MTTDKTARKERPIARGVLDYFPDALAEVAHVSFIGNQQHNPGEPMHWDKPKSPDHADCILRHLVERGALDEDGLRHSAKVAWRALAMLQIEMENETAIRFEIGRPYEKTIIPTHKTPDHIALFGDIRCHRDYETLIRLGCPESVAKNIIKGVSYTLGQSHGYVYIAGPMRDYPNFNFPAFDAARDIFTSKGFSVISPADIDRACHLEADQVDKVDVSDQATFAFRDFWSLYFLARQGNPANGIVLLPEWHQSIGASAEFFMGRWLKLKVYNPFGGAYVGNPVRNYALAHTAHKPSVTPDEIPSFV